MTKECKQEVSIEFLHILEHMVFYTVKWDPVRVASDMEVLTTNGSYVFHHEECLTSSQIKSYFSRLTAKQRSTSQAFNSKPQVNTLSSSSSSSSSNTNNTTYGDLNSFDELNEDEHIDDRDLETYSWRYMVDEARLVLDHSSATSASAITSGTPQTANISSKRKSVSDQSRAEKHRMR